jgi:hypothetical protein
MTTPTEKLRVFLCCTLAALTTSSCVTIPSKIIEIGPNTYSLNMTGIGLATQGNTNIKALSEASTYCDGLHKHLLVDQSSENGVYGWSPRQATLKFRCLDANDPDYLKKSEKTATPASSQ